VNMVKPFNDPQGQDLTVAKYRNCSIQFLTIVAKFLIKKYNEMMAQLFIRPVNYGSMYNKKLSTFL
jgi:hypothetical protein